MKPHLFWLLSLVLLTGCLPKSSPQNTVSEYLKAVQSSNRDKQIELSCLKGDLQQRQRIPQLNQWKVTGEEQLTDSTDRDATFYRVSVEADYTGTADQPVNRTWTFKVWESEELFQHQVRKFDEIQARLDSLSETTNEMRSMLGEAPLERVALSPPSRDQISDKPYCISSFETY